MEFHIVKLLFSLMSFVMVLIGGLVNNYEKFLPIFMVQSFRYGKFSYTGQSTRYKIITVPKRWFIHFYVYSSILSSFALILACKVLIYGEAPPEKVSKFFDLIGTSNRKANASSCAVFVSLILICAQTWKRLYETTCVSVFSDTSMNIIHYLIGFLHYSGVIFGILLEAPGFTPVSIEYKTGLSLWDLDWRIIVGTCGFLWAWYHQFVTARILANLRKNKRGNVVSVKHGLPRGHLFEYVSSPHLLCETVIYLALMFILWGNTIFPYILLWVVSNQMESALLAHWWYVAEFKDYPKERKAFIPFLV